jgi:hypothetical protein
MKKLFILAAAVAIGLASCNEGVTPLPVKEGNVAITLTNGGSTRADGDAKEGTAAENKISSLEIYVFDNAGGTPDVATGGGKGYVKIPIATTVTFPYSTLVQMSAGTNKDVIVVANANLGEPTDAMNSFDEVMAAIEDAELSATNSRTVPADGFVMSGHNLLANVVEGQTSTIEIAMDRLVARIEYPTVTTEGSGVAVDLDKSELEQIFGTGAVETDTYAFALKGYAVINALKKSSVGFVGNLVADGDVGTVDDKVYSVHNRPYVSGGIPGTNLFVWDKWTESVDDKGAITVGASVTARGGRAKTNSAELKAANRPASAMNEWTGVYSGSAFLTAGTNVYLFESKPDRKADESYSGYDPYGVIALIIEGQILNTTNSSVPPATRYWRVNVRKSDAYHIIRNSTYTTAINSITSPGHSTPWEAEEEKPIIERPDDTVGDFEISINDWTVKEVGNGQL